MKNMKTIFFYWRFLCILLAVVVITSSCTEEEEVDDTDPVVTNVTLNDATEDIQVNPGTIMHFDAVFSDNERLGEFKIDIHDNFDGHSHGRLSQVTDPFDTVIIVELIGREETMHMDIEIPENAATGPYHFNLQFFDHIGNEGELMTIDFEIVDEAEQPAITINNPDPATEFEIAPSATFTLDAIVTDPDGLVELEAYFEEEHDDEGHDHGRLSDEELWEMEWPLNGETEVVINESITIDAAAEVGHYELKIKAKDSKGNVKLAAVEVHIE